MSYLKMPNQLEGFENTDTTMGKTKSGKDLFIFHGEVPESNSPKICPVCNARMHANQHLETALKHLPFGPAACTVMVNRTQFLCPNCRCTNLPEIPFQAGKHRITEPLYNYTCTLPEAGFTLTDVAMITGLNKNTVRDIDLVRLENLYTTVNEEGERRFIKPEKPAQYLGIDEFKLHNGYQFATIIIDLTSGRVLWLAHGKKKSVVYDFIEHVGMEWMSKVKAVSCDMNSDYMEAFQEKCPHIQIVFDHFHIIKNFNEKVVDEVRKDEQRRLMAEGNTEGAQQLKRTNRILQTSRKVLAKKDQDAEDGKFCRRGSELLGVPPIPQKGGQAERYEALIQENELLLALDLVKGKLEEAYGCTDEAQMTTMIEETIDLCNGTQNAHFIWFGKLLAKHIYGIVSHAAHKISSGKLEGINNKIKTLRRKCYGLPNDDYFFLKLFDMSRHARVTC